MTSLNANCCTSTASKMAIYRRAILPIFTAEKRNQPLDRLVYVAAIEIEVPLPNREYKRLMVEGAKALGTSR